MASLRSCTKLVLGASHAILSATELCVLDRASMQHVHPPHSSISILGFWNALSLVERQARKKDKHKQHIRTHLKHTSKNATEKNKETQGNKINQLIHSTTKTSKPKQN